MTPRRTPCGPRIPKYYLLKRQLLDVLDSLPPGATLPPERGPRPRLRGVQDDGPPAPREAALLGTDVGTPLLLLVRRASDSAGSPVEWTRGWYRGDRCAFVVSL